MSRMPQVFRSSAEKMICDAGYRPVRWAAGETQYFRQGECYAFQPRRVRWTVADGEQLIAIPDLLPFLRGEA